MRLKLSCDDCDPDCTDAGTFTAYRPGSCQTRATGARACLEAADHQPLYLQSDIYAREGVDLDHSTLAGWVGATSELPAPLVEAVRDHVLSASKLHADDTRSRCSHEVTARRRPEGSGPMFAMTGPPTIRPRLRSGSPTRPTVKASVHGSTSDSCQGALEADAYGGFHHVYEGGAIYEVDCWAHARRKFHEIHIAHASPTTSEAMSASQHSTPSKARYAAVHRRSDKPSDRPEQDLCSTTAHLARSDAREALVEVGDRGYDLLHALALGALTCYVEDGQLEIDNNAAERALRVVALGRKNFLFAGSDSGGERVAATYSPLGSATLNGLDPEIYLNHVLQCMLRSG